MSRIRQLSLDELDAIPYTNEKGEQLDSRVIEREEQLDAQKYIPSHAVVLELGGRYGMAAASINHRLADPTQHIVLEPDPSVQAALQINKERHDCHFRILEGVISNTQLYFHPYGYCSFCSPVPSDHPVQSYTLKDIQELPGLRRFTHLVADCEGGFIDFFQENQEFLQSLEGIYFEMDNRPSMLLDYKPLLNSLQQWGFLCKQSAFRQYWERPSSGLKIGSEDLLTWTQPYAANSSK